MGKGVAPADVKDGAEGGAAGPGVYANRQVKPGRLPVNGEEVRIVQGPVSLDPRKNRPAAPFSLPKLTASIEASIERRGGTTNHLNRS